MDAIDEGKRFELDNLGGAQDKVKRAQVAQKSAEW